MRVKTDLFVSAIVRRVFTTGGFAAIERLGAGEAGAIFIRQRFRDGTETLYGPAPQSVFDTKDDPGRKFEIRAERQDSQHVATLLEREARFDSDLWVVEIEMEDLRELIDVA